MMVRRVKAAAKAHGFNPTVEKYGGTAVISDGDKWLGTVRQYKDNDGNIATITSLCPELEDSGDAS